MELSLEKKLRSRNPHIVRPCFQFDISEDSEVILLKFTTWSRYFFKKYFIEKGTGNAIDDAPFHAKIDGYNLAAYKGDINSFTDIAFRGASKSTRTKLFMAFCIANDANHFRKYIKALSQDGTNSTQGVTDIYNMFVTPDMKFFYPEVFEKTDAKREETRSSFTTATGIKMTAGTVGTEQRGHIQEESRPDFILFDDFETRKSLRSAVLTNSISDNMEEARTGLALGGSCIYNCNYVSERGNVHKLVEKVDDMNVVMITRIKDKKTGEPKWPAAYTIESIAQIEHDAEDFEGEYMCDPAASHDVYIDREAVNKQEARQPIREVSGFKMFYKFDPSHRYGGGMDVAGGVGLDSSTAVYIDFSTVPARVVGTYHDNTIQPTTFGDEIARQAEFFGRPIVAPENNKFDQCIGRLRQIDGVNLFYRVRKEDQAKVKTRVLESQKEYGFNTNSATKPTCDIDIRKAVEDGLIQLNDPALIAEVRSYTRDDAMDRDVDPRLTTRHFDLFRALAVAWQMRDYATVHTKPEDQQEPEEEKPRYSDIGI